jgi:hypothetical protein
VTTGSDNPYPKILVVEGSAPASPAAGRQALFIDSADHHWKRKNSGGTVTDLEATGGGSALTIQDEGSPLATAATTINFTGAGVTASGTGATKTVNVPGAAAEDPVATMLGTPDTAFEFASSSLTGLTAIGTATAEDAHTTIPDHYYVKKAATSSVALTGRYAAVSAPCTVVTKLKGHNVFGLNFTRLGGLFVGVATPGRVDAIHLAYNNGWVGTVVAYTNPTTFSATIGADLIVAPQPPVYYAIVATSTTNVAYYYSFDGYVWKTRTTGRDPSMTIGSAGIVVDPEQATHDVVGAYEYLRIWNSAKTLITG